MSDESASPTSASFQAWRVSQTKTRPFKFVGSETTLSLLSTKPKSNQVVIHVTHSSLNYKDALSASGNRGVTRSFPHTPGIDAAGVLESSGETVLVTGYDLGMNTAGGFGERIVVPSQWIISPNPFCRLSKDPFEQARLSMVYGTAGLTAALCVTKLLETAKAQPSDGTVVVTGASGGVGSMVVEILSKLGFQVVAVSGKATTNERIASKLKELGASTIVGREALKTTPALLSMPNYAHAIDTVGGAPLAALLKSIKPNGSVVACGNAAGLQLETTVLPFILRGIQLLGVDSVEISLPEKQDCWEKLVSEWRCPITEQHATEIGRHDLGEYLAAMLQGKSEGRVLLDHSMTV